MNGKQLKNSILQWAIQGKLVPQDPNDEPASVLLERIRAEKAQLIKEGKIKKDKNETIIFRGDDNSHYEKLPNGEVHCIDDEIPFEIPSNWAWVRVKHIVNVGSARRVHERDWRSTGVPFYRAREIGKLAEFGKVDNDLFIEQALYNEFSKSGVPLAGDLMVTAVGTLGKVYVVHENEVFYYKDGSVLCLENVNHLNPYFLKLAIESPCFINQYKGESQGTTVATLTMVRINEYLLPVPPLNEQNRIVAKIESLQPIIDKYSKAQQELDNLNSEVYNLLKKSILQEAIQGRLVPQDSNEEQATKLLERIRTEKQALVKQGKLKAKDITDSIIYKCDDNKYYEQIGNKTIEISEEIPFDIPESWMWCRLSQVVQINPKNKAEDNIEAAFIPMELIDATYFSSFTYETRKWRTIKSGFTHFADGDIAFAKITPCFQNRKSMILQNLPNGIGAGTTELKVLRPYAKTINDFYLLFFLESAYFVEQATFKGTANQQRIISGYMENKLFPLPPIDEQKRIVERIKELYSKL